MINIFYTKFTQELPVQLYNKYLNYLPNDLQEKNLRYIRWQDRHAHLYGKLLLLEALQYSGYNNYSFDQLKYNKYNRPYLSNDFDFNISHSGVYVFCAFGINIKVGLDVQQIKEVDLNSFKDTMNAGQWSKIKLFSNPMRKFYEYWTIKESVIKAEGKGLSIPLNEINIENGVASFDKNIWHIKALMQNQDYVSYLATEKEDISFRFIGLNFLSEL